ncbi:ActR/PrrA/RegA family redox response regulator transcription factor [Phreatobacter aquaticus]|uniref:ActR/PrrA/RegA family redox response regulator transcription factor n=1 Tax=Phreatobacter aquaticus TaxID=2570229 RepID=A0A4D7QXG8_9HYPH|nr:ActR/PrrA/RegA family redox response regulator transcription factor [Phreatobacter aquaticus]QCK88552.1 ActR/PrrA/RegA family redox response regulator transcription factor [Phreatobacter aquaticus]
MPDAAPMPVLPDPSLLIVDDDRAFGERLARAMQKRGFVTTCAESVAAASEAVKAHPPAFAVVDLRLEDGDGLQVVRSLRSIRPEARAIVLTGYGNIASAVIAVKAGAVDYLSKPADVDEIEAALLQSGEKAVPPEKPMSVDQVKWEHIQRVFELSDQNLSETARRLNMHRRTLQRMLSKRAPRDVRV